MTNVARASSFEKQKAWRSVAPDKTPCAFLLDLEFSTNSLLINYHKAFKFKRIIIQAKVASGFTFEVSEFQNISRTSALTHAEQKAPNPKRKFKD